MHIVLYMDHKFVTCSVILDKCHREGPGYWKQNKATLTYKGFLNRVRELVQRELTSAIINNRWWCAYKRAHKKAIHCEFVRVRLT